MIDYLPNGRHVVKMIYVYNDGSTEEFPAGFPQLPFITPNTIWGGCSTCGRGKDGKVDGYVCSRTDCPSRVMC